MKKSMKRFFVLIMYVDGGAESHSVHAGPFENYENAKDNAMEATHSNSNTFYVVKVEMGVRRSVKPVTEIVHNGLEEKR